MPTLIEFRILNCKEIRMQERAIWVCSPEYDICFRPIIVHPRGCEMTSHPNGRSHRYTIEMQSFIEVSKIVH